MEWTRWRAPTTRAPRQTSTPTASPAPTSPATPTHTVHGPSNRDPPVSTHSHPLDPFRGCVPTALVALAITSGSADRSAAVPLIGLELTLPSGRAVAETSSGTTERRVDLTTETEPKGPVRFALIRSKSGNFRDPAIRAGSLIEVLRTNANELNVLELSRFAALERLLDSVSLRADYSDSIETARHTIIVAFPHPGAADASAVVVSGPRSALTADAELADEVEAMLRGIRFLAPGRRSAEGPREVQTDPTVLRLTISSG